MITAIVFLPLLAAIVAGLGNRLLGNVVAKSITTGALFISCALSWPIFIGFMTGAMSSHVHPVLTFIQSGDLVVDWALRVDALTSVMLVVVTTDALVTEAQAEEALRHATAHSFDRIDSDGCMSTNDTVLLLASGASGVRPDPAEFIAALTDVCANLARQLIADAEGASKDIAIIVESAASVADALVVARAIARSNLLKCALHGEDPNWGRVLSAVGTTNAQFEPDRVDVAMNGVWICRGGSIGEPRTLVSLSAREIEIRVSLGAGSEGATVWTNDLTAEYVHENSAYAS